MHVLLVTADGDSDARRLADSLAAEGLQVRVVSRPGEADYALGAHRVDAVVFDPVAAGDGFLARARRLHPSQALVAWLARSSSSRAAELLEHGADEVLDGAMGPREVAARLRVAARRAGRPTERPLELGPLVVDVARGDVTWRGRELRLTRRERELLHVLAESAGRTVPRATIYREVWGYAMARGDRSVDVNVKRLRRKLAAVAGGEIAITTQPGVGYRLEVASSAGPRDVTALSFTRL